MPAFSLIKRSTIQLLRFHFSFFLMPVYWYALSETDHINNSDALLVFGILHLLVYPASNGYNSYMDRDTESVGGIQNPMEPTKQLFYTTLLMDALALTLSAFIGLYFVMALLAYILASRAYSYRGIRIKKYPVPGYLTVVLFQGALTYFMVMHGCSTEQTLHVPVTGMIVASLLIGGFYPLTQIYQHKQDAADGVTTLSMLLGYRGTFVFTALIYVAAMALLYYRLASHGREQEFLVLQLFFIPVLVYFFNWFYKVFHNQAAADFVNTMRMNLLASMCTNAAFITLFLIEKI